MYINYRDGQCRKSFKEIILSEYFIIFNEYFIKNHSEESDEGYFFDVDVQYLEKLHNLPNDLPF